MTSLFINWLIMIIMAYCRLAMRDAGLKASDFQSKSILFAMIGSLIKTNITNLDNFQDKSCLRMIWDPTVREKLGIGDRCMKSNKQELEGETKADTAEEAVKDTLKKGKNTKEVTWGNPSMCFRIFKRIVICNDIIDMFE